MFAFGRLIEIIIGQARKAKASVSQAGGGLQPVLALESQVPLPKLKELISRASARVLAQLIPTVGARPVLEVCEGFDTFYEMLKERGAAQIVHVDIGNIAAGKEKTPPVRGPHFVYAEAKKIPFDDNFFGFALACLTTPFQGEMVKSVKEIGRVLKAGGDIIITDFHPYGLYAKKGNVRLKSRETGVKGLEDYYKICKVAGLKVVDVKEVFIDETMRPFFISPDEKAAYKNIKDTPLIICLLAKKVE